MVQGEVYGAWAKAPEELQVALVLQVQEGLHGALGMVQGQLHGRMSYPIASLRMIAVRACRRGTLGPPACLDFPRLMVSREMVNAARYLLKAMSWVVGSAAPCEQARGGGREACCWWLCVVGWEQGL